MRNYRGSEFNSGYPICELSLADFKHIVTPELLAQLIQPEAPINGLVPKVFGFRGITFDELVTVYYQQIGALVDGGVDILLIETIFDTLNAKAALFAVDEVYEEIGKQYPVMISGTITDASGRTLSGQTTEAFLISMQHAPLMSIGLNCALGASALRPYLQVMSTHSPFFVSAYPNAGLPNEFGQYDESPAAMAKQVEEFCKEGLVNILGGCCGTTPDHIKAIADMAASYEPRVLPLAAGN
jgi:5-methyltetrahydrofolate--homocysteine methyltransferase